MVLDRSKNVRLTQPLDKRRIWRQPLAHRDLTACTDDIKTHEDERDLNGIPDAPLVYLLHFMRNVEELDSDKHYSLTNNAP